MKHRKGKKKNRGKAAFTAADLILKAETALEDCDADLALKYYTRALELVCCGETFS